jgi:hypothetical protein
VAHHLDPSPSPLSLLQTLAREQIVPGDPDDVLAFFADAVYLERIFDFRHAEVARRLGGGRTSGA